jgi:hypothetical protein
MIHRTQQYGTQSARLPGLLRMTRLLLLHYYYYYIYSDRKLFLAQLLHVCIINRAGCLTYSRFVTVNSTSLCANHGPGHIQILSLQLLLVSL